MIVRIDPGWLEIDLSDKNVSQADTAIHSMIRERERAAFTSMCAQVEQQGISQRSCSCGGIHTIKDSRLRKVAAPSDCWARLLNHLRLAPRSRAQMEKHQGGDARTPASRPGALSSRFGGVSYFRRIHCLAAGLGCRFGASRVR